MRKQHCTAIPNFKMSVGLYPIASLAQIQRTPSREDGIPEDLEEDLRAYGCKLVHQAGILLKQYVLMDQLMHLLENRGEQETSRCSNRSNSVPTLLVRIIYERIRNRG